MENASIICDRVFLLGLISLNFFQSTMSYFKYLYRHIHLILLLIATTATIFAQVEQDSVKPQTEWNVPLPPPPPPPPPHTNVETDFDLPQTSPRFPGCENLKSIQEKNACSKEKMLDYLYRHLQYPDSALIQKIEGVVVIRFVVNEKGEIENPKVMRDIGGGCGEEALRLVNMMRLLPQKWTPGTIGNSPVKILYTLPVKFKLHNNP
jgi:protein TonB